MARKNSLKATAVKIGSAVGRLDGKAHKAANVARQELAELSKQVESLKKQIEKSTKKLQSALK